MGQQDSLKMYMPSVTVSSDKGVIKTYIYNTAVHQGRFLNMRGATTQW